MAAIGPAMPGRRTSSTAFRKIWKGPISAFPIATPTESPIQTSSGPIPALTGPHSAGLGIIFYTGNMFPDQYKNVAFIARRGSWNRDQKFGYDVVMARTSGQKAKIEPFMTGLLDEKANTFHGRPTYVLQLPDGALLVSDEQNGAVYRISYDGKVAQR